MQSPYSPFLYWLFAPILSIMARTMSIIQHFGGVYQWWLKPCHHGLHRYWTPNIHPSKNGYRFKKFVVLHNSCFQMVYKMWHPQVWFLVDLLPFRTWALIACVHATHAHTSFVFSTKYRIDHFTLVLLAAGGVTASSRYLSCSFSVGNMSSTFFFVHFGHPNCILPIIA